MCLIHISAPAKILSIFLSATTLFFSSTAWAFPPGDNWQIVFNDDFRNSKLDSSKWSSCFFWADKEGCTNGGAGDLQWFSPNNVSVGGGILRLRAERKPSNGLNYTSGMIASHDKFAFQYGYVEFRAKVPKGNGFWPTLWLLSQNKNWPPEIDVAEFVGSNTNNVYMTLHYQNGSGAKDSSSGWWGGIDFSADYHTYGLLWEADKLVWYVDGVERRRYINSDNIPDEPMYVAATLALGKAWTNKPPDSSTRLPERLSIDYVKVWQRR
ncbi:hypothetical protein C7B80_21850 [Cyanosarcina cf. burmensis CCALA 770]|nr:hypothetical protein C7B80_21850 [Cyanosarcina cf. burmensis CCALA 770]